MNTKLTVVDLLREAGLDFVLACEEYERVAKLVRTSDKSQTFYLEDGTSFTLAPKPTRPAMQD